MEAARSAGALIAFDPNHRPRLWPDAASARMAIEQALEVADIAGLHYDPVRSQCSLTSDPSVNYLIHLKRHA